MAVFAQETINQEIKVTSVSQLDFLIGTWKGEGWKMDQNRQRVTFTQTETIVPKVENSILVVDGMGYAKDETSGESKVVHDAYGLMAVNEDLGIVTMLSYSVIGGKMETPIRLIGEKIIQWSFDTPNGGKTRFTADFSKEGFWTEKGEFSPDGERWFPFIEMNLEKVE